MPHNWNSSSMLSKIEILSYLDYRTLIAMGSTCHIMYKLLNNSTHGNAIYHKKCTTEQLMRPFLHLKLENQQTDSNRNDLIKSQTVSKEIGDSIDRISWKYLYDNVNYGIELAEYLEDSYMEWNKIQTLFQFKILCIIWKDENIPNLFYIELISWIVGTENSSMLNHLYTNYDSLIPDDCEFKSTNIEIIKMLRSKNQLDEYGSMVLALYENRYDVLIELNYTIHSDMLINALKYNDAQYNKTDFQILKTLWNEDRNWFRPISIRDSSYNLLNLPPSVLYVLEEQKYIRRRKRNKTFYKC